MKEKRKSKAGRNPKLDPAVYRYTVRFNEEEHMYYVSWMVKMLLILLISGLYQHSSGIAVLHLLILRSMCMLACSEYQ